MKKSNIINLKNGTQPISISGPAFVRVSPGLLADAKGRASSSAEAATRLITSQSDSSDKPLCTIQT
jgi:hypothetical protein